MKTNSCTVIAQFPASSKKKECPVKLQTKVEINQCMHAALMSLALIGLRWDRAITPQVNFETAVSAGIGKLLKRADTNSRACVQLTEQSSQICGDILTKLRVMLLKIVYLVPRDLCTFVHPSCTIWNERSPLCVHGVPRVYKINQSYFTMA